MDLFEYQGKLFFARYGIPISPGEVVVTAEDAVIAAERLGYPVVVKAQVLVGGRGKAGGNRRVSPLRCPGGAAIPPTWPCQRAPAGVRPRRSWEPVPV